MVLDISLTNFINIIIMIKLIKIDSKSRIPKYLQIVDSVIQNIKLGNIEIDDQMPSINLFSEEFIISRDTVERAYSVLKERNIIYSVRGKGFYIAKTKLIAKINVLFLVNKLSSYKMRFYNSFIESVGPNCHSDLHIYHCDESLFVNLINKYKSSYDYYLIMPHFKDASLQHVTYTEKALMALKSLPQDRLILMDNINIPESDDVNAIYQDYEEDIFDALTSGIDKILNYKKLILIYPEQSVYPYPKRILYGFKKFCVSNNLEYEVLDVVFDDMILRRGDLFITIEESDLVMLIKLVRENEFQLGKEVGVISYNDTSLKELFGITVASTDFKEMGELAAQMILENTRGRIKLPFHLIERESL